jgi:flagellar assembly protein FliH
MSSKLHRSGLSEAFERIDWQLVGAKQPVRQLPSSAAQVQAAEADEAVWRQRIEQARQEGVRQGEKTGFERASAQLQPVMDRMTRSIEQTAAYRTRFRLEAEQQMVQLSLAVARRILRRELTVDPEALSGLVRSALSRLSLREIAEIRVHPSQQRIVESVLNQIGSPVAIRVSADPGLEAGALLIESRAGTLDASVETQLEEIGRGFADLVKTR